MPQPTYSFDPIHGQMPYGQIWRAMGNVIPGLIRTGQAVPSTLRTLGQLQTGERQAPAGPARGLQWMMQQADIAGGKKGRVAFHPEDFAAMPGAVAHYYHQYATPQGWQKLRDDPVGSAADLSAVGAAPEDIARTAAGLAARVGAPDAVRGAIGAARTVTRPLATAAEAINPARPVLAAGTAAYRGARGTLGMFDRTGAFTPQGLAQLQKTGSAAFPNGAITAAEYADPRFQAHMAPIIRRSGFSPRAFKQGVLSYNGAPTPTAPLTGLTPRGAPAQATTADLIDQGHQIINTRAKNIGQVSADAPDPTAGDIRALANAKNPKVPLSQPARTDLRLAAAGKDVLDASTVTRPPSLVSTVGGPIAKGAWDLGLGATGWGLGALAAAGHSPLLGGIADIVPEAIGAGSALFFGHKSGLPGAIGSVAKGVGDWAEARAAGQGAPKDWLDVPSWTGKAIERAAPAGIALGQDMDPGRPTPPGAPAPAPDEEAPPPGGWQAPPAYVPPTTLDAGPPVTAAPPESTTAPEAAPPPESTTAPVPTPEPRHETGPKGSEHDAIAPPELQKLMPQEYKPPTDLGAESAPQAAAPQAAGGRVGFADGGNVTSMVDRLMARAEREGKATRTATKPLLGLDDTTVAKALAIASRAI